jgi:hypothetical protein
MGVIPVTTGIIPVTTGIIPVTTGIIPVTTGIILPKYQTRSEVLFVNIS